MIMTKKSCWLNLLKIMFVGHTSDPEKEERRRFLHPRVDTKRSLPSSQLIDKTLSEAAEEQGKHALAVAIATAAAAEAAVAAVQAAAEVVRLTGTPAPSDDKVSVVAAVKIQTAFRGYLARKALRALKALVKFQAVVRGRAVRRQTRETFRSLQSLMKIQRQMREMRNRAVMNQTYGDIGLPVVFSNDHKLPSKFEINEPKWDGSFLSKEKANVVLHKKQEVAFRQHRTLEYAYSQQERKNTEESTGSLDAESGSDEANPRWSWLEQWVDAQPLRREALKQNLWVNPCQYGTGKENSSILSNRDSFRDADSSSSLAIPSFMGLTETSRAKARPVSTPKQRIQQDSSYEYTSPSKTRLYPSASYSGNLRIGKMVRSQDLCQLSPCMKNLYCSSSYCNPRKT